MDPDTLASEFSRLQEEQAQLRDDARFLIEHADRLAETTEQLAAYMFAGPQSPPPRKPPGRRQPGHYRGQHVRLRLIQGGAAAAVAVVAGWRLYLRHHVLAATVAGITAAAATGTVAALTAVMILPVNPGPAPVPHGSHGVLVRPVAGTPLTPRPHRRRQPGARASTRPVTPRRGRSLLPRRPVSPSPSGILPVPVPTLPTLLPSPSPSPSKTPAGGPVCILGICL